MPLAKLRLINKPGTKRKKKWPSYSKKKSSKKNVSKKIVSKNKVKPKKKTVSKKKVIKKNLLKKNKQEIKKKKTVKTNTSKKKTVKKVNKIKKTISQNQRSSAVARKVRRKRKKAVSMNPRRRKSTSRRKSPKRVAAGRKAARTRARNKAARMRAGRKAARTRSRSRARVNSSTNLKRRRRRKSTKRLIGKPLRLKPTPRSKKRRKYNIVRKTRKSKTGKSYYKYSIKRNPFAQMKSALIHGAGVFAGVLGMRVLGNVLKKNVFDKYATSIPDTILPILPSLSGFIASTLLIPRIVKNKNIVQSIQYGATYSMFEALFGNFIQDKLPDSVKEYTGIGGTFNVYEPVSEYIPGLGEYVHDNRLGNWNVSEAMAGYEGITGDEYEYMQTGGAGGSLARTVFTE